MIPSTYTGVCLLCMLHVYPESHFSSEIARYWSVGDTFVLNKQNGEIEKDTADHIVLKYFIYYSKLVNTSRLKGRQNNQMF